MLFIFITRCWKNTATICLLIWEEVLGCRFASQVGCVTFKHSWSHRFFYTRDGAMKTGQFFIISHRQVTGVKGLPVYPTIRLMDKHLAPVAKPCVTLWEWVTLKLDEYHKYLLYHPKSCFSKGSPSKMPLINSGLGIIVICPDYSSPVYDSFQQIEQQRPGIDSCRVGKLEMSRPIWWGWKTGPEIFGNLWWSYRPIERWCWFLCGIVWR